MPSNFRLFIAVVLTLAAPRVTVMAATVADASGFTAVFNGTDLSGWVVEGTSRRESDGAAPVWSVADGALICRGEGYGFLRYDHELGDFVLKLQYRMEPRVNSGVGIRHVKYTGERASRPSFSGYEIQLFDEPAGPPSKKSSGSLYRYVAAERQAARPAGQWNDLTVACRGPLIKVTLNGQQLHDVDQRRRPDLAEKPLRGFISLQNHGGDVAFRKIMLKELD